MHYNNFCNKTLVEVSNFEKCGVLMTSFVNLNKLRFTVFALRQVILLN